MAWTYSSFGTALGWADGHHELSGVLYSPAAFDYPANGVFDPTTVTRITTGAPYDAACGTGKALVQSHNGGDGSLIYRVAMQDDPACLALSGEIRASIRVNTNNRSPGAFGIICLGTTAAMDSGTSSKGFSLYINTAFDRRVIEVGQVTDGISGPPGTSIGSNFIQLFTTDFTVPPFNNDEILTLILRWESIPAILKGTYLRASYIRASGVEAFLCELVYTGALSYKPSSPVVGGCGVWMSGGTSDLVVYFDNIQVRSV
mgnify:CR=1 FL=1